MQISNSEIVWEIALETPQCVRMLSHAYSEKAICSVKVFLNDVSRLKCLSKVEEDATVGMKIIRLKSIFTKRYTVRMVLCNSDYP